MVVTIVPILSEICFIHIVEKTRPEEWQQWSGLRKIKPAVTIIMPLVVNLTKISIHYLLRND